MIVHAAAVTLAAFPSGHATDAAAFFLATSFVLATTITITSRRYVQVLLVTGRTIATVAVTVVVAVWYLCSHRPTTRRGPVQSQ